jgi:hypothetical protein
MDGDFTMARMIEAPRRCEDGLKLRERLVKLRWMRLDGEADRLANEILNLDCALPRTLPRRVPDTD